jgi:hypothetical protein
VGLPFDPFHFLAQVVRSPAQSEDDGFQFVLGHALLERRLVKIGQ